MNWQLLSGDCLEQLRTLPDESVNCIVTSPPYFGLRDYGCDGQLGLEDTPQEFIQKLTEVFRECRRVLVKDGTCWVNLGDTYASDTKGSGGASEKQLSSPGTRFTPRKFNHGLKAKDLIGIPWRVALALQDDGWYLRQDIIWAKPNPMPESVRDRCTKAHEYIFMLTKSAKYWYDSEAIREVGAGRTDVGRQSIGRDINGRKASGTYAQNYRRGVTDGVRNARSVWAIATEPYPEAHFAVFPSEIPKRCILAGCPENGTVLDPFAGSGTTLAVAVELGRKAIGIELNPEYCGLVEKRMLNVTPSLFGLEDAS